QRAPERSRHPEQVLELIDEKEEVPSFSLVHRCSREDRLPELRDEERAHQRRRRLPPTTNGQIREQDLSGVDDAPRVDGRVDLTEDASETRPDEEVAELVEHRPDGFVALVLGQPAEPDPEAIETERVVEGPDRSDSERGVGEEQRYVREGHAGP